MYEFILSLKNEIGFYFNLLKLLFYFLTGAIAVVLIGNIYKLIIFFFSKFDKKIITNNIIFLLQLLVQIIGATILGWIIISLIF